MHSLCPREINERANSLNYGGIATFHNYSAVAVCKILSEKAVRDYAFTLLLLSTAINGMARKTKIIRVADALRTFDPTL